MTDSRPDGQPITVFLLDDHEMVRRELRELLGAEPDIRVVGDAGTAASALTQIRALHPDVAILDVRLPDSDGIAVCREIRAQMPDTACLMLTAYYDDRAGRERGPGRVRGLHAEEDPQRRVALGGAQGRLWPAGAGPGRDEQAVAKPRRRGVRANRRAPAR